MHAVRGAREGGVEAGRVHAEGGRDRLQRGRARRAGALLDVPDHAEGQVCGGSEMPLRHAAGLAPCRDAVPRVVGHAGTVPPGQVPFRRYALTIPTRSCSESIDQSAAARTSGSSAHQCPHGPRRRCAVRSPRRGPDGCRWPGSRRRTASRSPARQKPPAPARRTQPPASRHPNRPTPPPHPQVDRATATADRPSATDDPRRRPARR